METILVTGGAGYIGSHFVYKVNKLNKYKICVVDNFRESRNNIILDENISYHETDIRDKNSLLKIFKTVKPICVLHFAALASVPDSMKNPFDYYDTNVIGGINLLECMREVGVNKIIFSSSASIYGEPQLEVIDESHRQLPTNSYGYTKLIFENILKDYHRSYGFDSISFRYFCASGCAMSAGIGEHHEPETHVIPSIVNTILGKREKFFVYGNDYATPDGTGVRDYIHVLDLADAHILAMNKIVDGGSFCAQYNLGINKGFSVLELIKEAERVSGKTCPYEFKPRRPGDPSRLIADASKAKKELQWSPQFLEIRDMVESAYLFFKNK